MMWPGMRKFRRHLMPIVPDHLLDPEVPALIRFPRKFTDGWRLPPSDLTWHATPGMEMVPCCELSSAWWTSGTLTPTVCTLSPSSSGYWQGCRTRNAWRKSSRTENGPNGPSPCSGMDGSAIINPTLRLSTTAPLLVSLQLLMGSYLDRTRTGC